MSAGQVAGNDRVGVERIRRFMNRNPDGFVEPDEVADALASYQPHRARARNFGGLAKNLRVGADGRYRWHWDPGFQVAQVDLKERREWLSACARKLQVPTLLVRGLLSDLLTEEGAQDFLGLCRHAEHVRVADAAHMVAGDRNDASGSA